MKFERNVLIEKVKAEIARREALAAEKTAEAAANWREARARYVTDMADAWNTFANAIKRRVRAGQPVENGDVPVLLKGGRHGHGSVYLITWDGKGPSVTVADVTALATLLALLEANLADTTSTTELERMGFRMADLFRVR